MSWTIARGQDDGNMVIVRIDEDFRDPAKRGGRSTRVSVRFLGAFMLQFPEKRGAFEELFDALLEGYGGVFVAGVTRTRPVSYTFIGYCSGNIEPSDVRLDEALKPIGAVSISDDPQWVEYESWLPTKATGVAAVTQFVRGLWIRFLMSIKG